MRSWKKFRLSRLLTQAIQRFWTVLHENRGGYAELRGRHFSFLCVCLHTISGQGRKDTY
jgi:hypothetical protein